MTCKDDGTHPSTDSGQQPILPTPDTVMVPPVASHSDHFVKVGWFGNALVNTKLLKSRTTRQQLQLLRRQGDSTFSLSSAGEQPEEHICGMRSPLKSLSKVPANEASPAVRRVIDAFLDKHLDVQADVLTAIQGKCNAIGPEDPRLDVLRMEMASVLGAMSIKGVESDLYNTRLRADLLYAWAKMAQDPAQEVASWLWTGAPAGIVDVVPDWGIFPKSADASAEMDYSELASSFESSSNYSSVDDDPAAAELVSALLDKTKGWVRCFPSQEAAADFLGAPPVLSKLHVLTKEKRDSSGKLMRIKRRLILDCKRSNVNGASKLTQQIVLPRATDLVDDALAMLWWNEWEEECA